MAIFKEEKQDSRNGGGEGALSIIAAGMTVSGDIESTGVVKVEGRVDGSIRSARQVLVGRQVRSTVTSTRARR
jgi:cytoskeletal protein CcmA (bactofilin family)